MEKREQINNENTFVPKTDFVYPEEPNTPFLQPKIKHEIKIDSDYPFLSKKLKIAKSDIVITKGLTSRDKTLEIECTENIFEKLN